MFSNLFFFYGGSCSHNDIKFHLEKFHKPFKIITNRIRIQEFLINCGEDVEMIDETIPNVGTIGEEIYENSKNILMDYDRFFQKILFEDISIYEGFQYKFLGMFVMFSKMIKILEQKKNVIFLFEGFYPIYFMIEQQILNEKKYENFKIQKIKGKQIENIVNNGIDSFQKNQNSFSFQRTQSFFKLTMTNKTNIKKIGHSILFFNQIVRLIINKIIFKYFTANINNKKKILNRIDKKIKNAHLDLSPISTFFVTSSREDLHLAPWYPIFKRFMDEGKKFQIFTSDLSTSMLLRKEKLPFINLFEEVNILTNSLKYSSLGIDLQNKIENEIKNNQKILGLEFIYGDLIQRIFRAISIAIILKQIFFRLNIRSVMLGADGDMLENIAVEIAKKNKIPSYSMLSVEIDPAFPWFADWFHADKIFLNGENSKNTLKKLNYSEDRLIVFGNPKFDKLKINKLNESKKFLFDEFNIDSNKKLIVIGMSRWHHNDQIWMSNLIKFCSNKNIEIIIKIHPKFKSTGSNEISKEKINQIKNNCSNEKFLISYDLDINKILSAADLFITDYSMLGIEAILYDNPVIIVDFEKEDVSYNLLKIAIDKGAALYIDEYNDLENKILEILNDVEKKSVLYQSIKKIKDEYNKFNDGKASDRIFDLLTN